MATVAPGQPSSHQEPSCYNCGMQGHWVMACPEPTREVPAGLQRWQTRTKNQDQGSERAAPSDRRGPVVTRYPPPPPHQGSGPGPYGPPPPPSQMSPPPPFPPAGPSPPNHGYPQPYPPPPPPAGYRPSYAESVPVSPYNQYVSGPAPGGPSPAPPPPPFYGSPPAAYGQQQHQYPQQYQQPPLPPAPPAPGYYQNAPPPSFPPPPPQSYAPGTYPLPQYSPPAAYPPGPTSSYAPAPPPPPPPDYQYPPTAHSQYGPPQPPSAPNPYQGDTGWGPPPPPPPGYGAPPSHPYPSPTASGTYYHRDRRDNRDRRDRKDRRDRDKDRGRRQKHDDSRRYSSFQKESGQSIVQDLSLPKKLIDIGKPLPERQPDPDLHRDEDPPTLPSPDTTVSEQKKDTCDEGDKEEEEGEDSNDGGEWGFSKKDLDAVFPEATRSKDADPVGTALALEYNDLPTIPPAYDARCIKSKYFNETNQSNFIASVRRTSDWILVKDDPVFRFYTGMVSRRFDGYPYDYPAYELCPPPSPSGPIKMPPRLKIDRDALLASRERKSADVTAKRGGDHHRDKRPYRDHKEDRRLTTPAKRQMEGPSPQVDRDTKRLKSSPSQSQWSPAGDENSRRRSPVRKVSRSPRPSLHHNHRDLGAAELSDHDRPSTSWNSYKKSYSPRDDRPYSSALRHDSGYHSGQSQEKFRLSHREGERDLEQDLRERDRDRDRDRARNRIASDRDRAPRRRDSRSRTRSMSPAPPPRRRKSTSSFDSRSDRSSSPLTLMEAELLGLAEPDAPTGSKRRKEKSVEPPKKKKPVKKGVKVSAAFSRRW